MKFTKHQKEIIKKINSGEVYDVYSYLKVFNLLTTFKYNTDEIKKLFNREYEGKQYKVLKEGKSHFSIKADLLNGIYGSYNEIQEDDCEYKSATLSFEGLAEKIKYKDLSYTFNPYSIEGVELANSFENIKEFIVI